MNGCIDYQHVINRKMNGRHVTLFFQKEKNLKLKDMVMDILIDSFENRIQDYIENDASCTLHQGKILL